MNQVVKVRVLAQQRTRAGRRALDHAAQQLDERFLLFGALRRRLEQDILARHSNRPNRPGLLRSNWFPNSKLD
jgi:hypothetical protein